RFGVYFDRLDQFRNPPAHSRELLPFERDLLAGMAGEIRNRVTIYRSEMGPSREYYPRIEWVRDSFGNSSASEDARMQDVFTKVRLAIGQQVTFQCRGWDPQGRDLNWRLEEQGIGRPRLDTATGTDVTLSFTAAREHVGDSLSVAIVLVGSGEYHRYGPGSYDGVAAFHYAVSPPTDLT
ncbi:MAG: hypothetical protein VX494_09545, partial [Actinomycetota bacterium]|nr:hypothetical protein [Actinomycetota bacterium]